jgi:hypothetical protein
VSIAGFCVLGQLLNSCTMFIWYNLWIIHPHT